MDENAAELNQLFAVPDTKLAPDVLRELQSICRLHDLEPQELFYKWESYCLKMGAEETTLDLKTARDFKKDIQETLERENRGKQHKAAEKKSGVTATPRAGGADVFGMLDGLVPNTPRQRPGVGVNGSTVKRKSNFETPAAKTYKNHMGSSPGDFKTPQNGNQSVQPFAERIGAGQVTETLNDHIEVPEPPEEPPAEARIKLKANTELSKFNYKIMAMKLSEASEILDDRIDEFIEIIKEHHNLEDSEFGNPAAQSTSDIVAIGRIASDSSEGRLNTASLVLETSRRYGAGLRVPLKVRDLPSTDFFAGQIVALKGSNASGEFFVATEILPLPLLKPAASPPQELDTVLARLQTGKNPDLSPTENASLTRPLNILVASGPYTNGQDLDLAPLHTLLDKALESRADALILTGPFLDTEHPAIRNGTLDLPSNPDTATMATAFRHLISGPLNQLAAALPSISIIVGPSVRDAASKHAAFPQDRFVKKELGLPKQASTIPNPVTLSLNEAVFGICTADPLDAIRRTEVLGGKAAKPEPMQTRFARKMIEQRSFFPVFPPPARDSGQPLEGDTNGVKAEEDDEESVNWGPMGTMMDTSYMKLTEWLNCRPDVLVVPSTLKPFAQVVESVLVVNPGTLSKRNGAGTYARLTMQPPQISDEDRTRGTLITHQLFKQTRVDIVKI